MRLLPGFLLVTLALAETGPIIPHTPAGDVLRAWLAAVNSGNRAEVTNYVNRFEPDAKDHIDGLLDFHERTGGFDVVRIQKSEPLRLEALMKEHAGTNFAQLTVEVNDGPSPTVKQLRIGVVPRPADQPGPARVSFEGAVQALDHEAGELAGKDRFSGAVLVARGGKIALEKAYGLADREKQLHNTVDTQFRIGSMNKMFTATAILQLAGEGKIDLEAPLGKYLTDYPNRELAMKVTIRHLLTHTGGTGDIFTPEYEKHRLEMREPGDYLKLYGARGLEFEPGSKWAYSNYGFVLLGLVVEKVSGMSYYDYVDKKIFEKAGMQSTGSLPETEHLPKRSTGYIHKDGAWISNTDTLPWRGSSAGGGYSTVGDLYRFAQALSNGKLIDPTLFSRMTSAQPGEDGMPPGERYGFGMMVSETPQGKRIGHGGGAPGMNGELRIYQKTDTVIVVLANLDPPAASRLADFFGERMPLE